MSQDIPQSPTPTQIPQELLGVLEAFEFRNDGPPEDADIGDIWISGIPIGKIIDGNKKRTRDNESRIRDLETGEIDPDQAIGSVDTEKLPPIHQMYLSVQAGNEDAMTDNQRRAAKIWPYFAKYSDSNYGGMSLTSTKIKDIFNRELDGEEDDPYSKTVKRVMKQLARFSDGLLEFDTDTNPNRIRADKDDWEELLVRVEEGMNGDDPDDPVNPETGSGEGSYSEDGKDDTVVSVSDAEEVGRQ